MAEPTNVLANGVKLVGETLIPGSSLMMDGRIGSGMLHTVAAVVAGAVLGPIGMILVIANSYSKAVNDQHLWQLGSAAVQSISETVRSTRSSAPG